MNTNRNFPFYRIIISSILVISFFMGNTQENQARQNIQQMQLQKKIEFKYLDPIKFPDENFANQLQKQLGQKSKFNKVKSLTKINASLRRPRQAGKFKTQFHKQPVLHDQKQNKIKKIQSIKVKWNQFIKFKKRNFFQDYQIIHEIGEGGYGAVYKVKAIYIGIFRAAKKIQKNKLIQELEQKLLQQVQIMMSLDHPNINKVLEVYESQEYYFVISQLCEGGELFTKIVAKTLTQKSAASIMKQIISALVYIHSKNIIHRDIKPQNMLFQKGTTVLKIIDFGISCKIKQKQKLSERIGSPYYIAPQVIYKNYDQKCDIWSAGIILYMMLMGGPPVNGKNQKEVITNILKCNFKFQGKNWKNISPLGKQFLKKMLQKNPQYRFSAVEALNHPWIAQADYPEQSYIQFDPIQNICKFKFKNKLQAVVLTYIVSQVLSFNERFSLLKSFKEADANSDGVISFQQMKNLIQKKFPNFIKSNDQKINKLLQSIDTNNSGDIDYTQFIVASLDKTFLRSQHFQRAFEYFDIDHSGGVTFAQIIQFLQNSNQSVMAIKKMFQEVDINNDGQVSKAEFVSLMEKYNNCEDTDSKFQKQTLTN